MIKKGIYIVLMVLSVQGFSQVKDANTLIKQGNQAYANKDFLGAYQAYDSALVMLSKEGKVDTTNIYNAGYCALKANKFNEAIPYLEKSIELNYKAEKPYVSLGQVYMKLNDLVKMEKVLSEGLIKYPTNGDLSKLMSNCYLKQGLEFYKIGNDIKSKANNSGLNKTDTVAFRAEYAKADDQFRKALPYMESAVKYDEKNDKALKALQNIYVNLEMTAQAEDIKKKLETL
jgi:tetratricopeptide (TPR) repeat protein